MFTLWSLYFFLKLFQCFPAWLMHQYFPTSEIWNTNDLTTSPYAYQITWTPVNYKSLIYFAPILSFQKLSRLFFTCEFLQKGEIFCFRLWEETYGCSIEKKLSRWSWRWVAQECKPRKYCSNAAEKWCWFELG